jgi:hypothetical protein
MEQTANTSPEVATDEPTSAVNLSLAREPHQLTDSLIEEAVAAGRGNRPGWSGRADGWTDDRIRTFLAVLTHCGVVADACRAVGLSPQSAYAFRTSRNGGHFDVAWRAAQLAARQRLADHLMSRALDGYVELIRRDGEVVAERHRYDNRLSMAVLTRLDHLAGPDTRQDEAARIVVDELEDYVESLCAGPEAAAAFIEARSKAEQPAEEKIITPVKFERIIIDPSDYAKDYPPPSTATFIRDGDPRLTQQPAAMQRPSAGSETAGAVTNLRRPSDRSPGEARPITRIERVIVDPPVRADRPEVDRTGNYPDIAPHAQNLTPDLTG